MLYKEKIENDAKYYIWDDPYLWRLYSDQVLHFCHSAFEADHYGLTRTIGKVLDCRFYWPTIFKDAHQFVSNYEECH
ncbi:hypothetical protein CR513_15213, partial [Mucuna pruriens]